MEPKTHETFKNEIMFDQQTWEILEQINPIHRHSLINAAIKMISKTNYYKELAGLIDTEQSDEVVDLNNTSVSVISEIKSQEPEIKPKKKKSVW